jgi:hypothetical protein
MPNTCWLENYVLGRPTSPARALGLHLGVQETETELLNGQGHALATVCVDAGGP